MTELQPDVFVTNIVNRMSNKLDNEQLSYLKNTLYINLHDVQLSLMNYDLVVTDDNSDATLMSYFTGELRMANKSEKTIKQYGDAAWKLRSFVNKPFRDITHMDIKFYFASMQKDGRWGDKTAENNYNYINALFTYLFDSEYISKNPMKKVPRIKVTEKKKSRYSNTEVEKMLNTCSKDIRVMAILEFFLSSALRVESVSILKWKDLDFKTRSGIVRVKGGNEEKFRFNEKTEFYLNKYLKERMNKENRTYDEMMERPLFACSKRDKITKDYEAMGTNGYRTLMKKVGKKSGVTNVHPHRFRRTFACNAIEHGMPMEEVKEHLMHKDIQTTFIYADITETKLEHSYRQYCE